MSCVASDLFRRTGEREPFPHGDERFGPPRRSDLYMEVLEETIAP